MKEFMLIIKAIGNPVLSLPKEQQQQHIQKVGGFIQGLAGQGKLKDAQPLLPTGVSITNYSGSFTEEAMDESKEMMAGYYLINAEDIEEAKKIAKSDPRFEDGKWRMEIREILKIETIND